MITILKITAGAILVVGLALFAVALCKAAGWADRSRPPLPQEPDISPAEAIARAGVTVEEATEAAEAICKLARNWGGYGDGL
ncbi:MAG: hypothetical protein LUD78_13090 [Clostridiales bacterium]|nr:hypothetical protein [Clostridiales bacterium]